MILANATHFGNPFIPTPYITVLFCFEIVTSFHFVKRKPLKNNTHAQNTQ